MDLGPWELAIIAIVILVLFGSKKLPDTARSLGRSLRIFKSETKGLHEDEQKAAAAPAPAPAPQQQPVAPQQLPPGTDGAPISGVPVSQPVNQDVNRPS